MRCLAVFGFVQRGGKREQDREIKDHSRWSIVHRVIRFFCKLLFFYRYRNIRQPDNPMTIFGVIFRMGNHYDSRPVFIQLVQ